MIMAVAMAIATFTTTKSAARKVSRFASVFRFRGSGRFVGILEPSMLASVIGGPRYRFGGIAEQLRSVMAELAALSANQAAAELNRRQIATASGGRWFATQVIRLRERLAG
jgi:hypothetical protein